MVTCVAMEFLLPPWRALAFEEANQLEAGKVIVAQPRESAARKGSLAEGASNGHEVIRRAREDDYQLSPVQRTGIPRRESLVAMARIHA